MKIWTIGLIALSGLLVGCTAAITKVSTTSPSSTNATLTATQAPAQPISPYPSPTPTPVLLPTFTATPTPAPTANLELERVAQLGGSINGITIVGDVAFVGMGPRVAAIDVSQHDSPQLIGQSEPLPGLVTHLLTIHSTPNNRILVNAGKYLVLLDTSDINVPVPLSQLELPGAITTMLLDEGHGILYAGGSVYQSPDQSSYFIVSIDVSPQGGPKLLDIMKLSDPITSLAIAPGSIFVGSYSYTAGLYRIKLEAPGKLSSPQVVIASNAENTFTFYSMQVIGNRLYAGVNMDMQAYDITNPGQSIQVWSEFIGFTAYGFSPNGAQIDIFGWSGAGTYLPGQTSLLPPEPVTGEPFGQVASIVAWHKDDFLVAYQDLEIYAPNDTQGLELVGSYQQAVIEVLGAASDEQAVYVVDNGAGDGKNKAILRVFSLPDLQPLGLVATEVTNSWGWFGGLAVEGDRAYLAARDDLWAYDLSSPSPTLLNKLDIIEGPLNAIAAIKLGNRRILILFQEQSDSGGLTAYDVTDAKKPVRMGRSLKVDQGLIYQMTWDGSTLYAVGSAIYESDSDMLYLAGFDGEDLTLWEKLPLPGSILSMAVDNGLVALSGTAGMTLVSAEDARSPEIVAQITLPERGLGVALLKSIVLVMVGGNNGVEQLLAFDVQDRANPRQVKSMDIAFSAGVIGPIPTSNPYMILAGWSTGVEVMEALVSSTCLDAQARPQAVPPREQPLEVRFRSDGNIWLWDEGAPARQISDTGDALHFTFSPDGQAVVFERVTGDYPWGQFKIELWAINRDGSNLRQLVSGEKFDSSLPGREEAWAANTPIDFRWFSGTHDLSFGVYSHINAIGASFAAQGYWIVNADTGALKKWDHPLWIDPYGPKKIVSPDGKYTALVDREAISLQKSEGSLIRKDALTYQANNNAEGYGWGPPAVVWSPDSLTLKVVVWDKDAYYDSFSTWEIPVDGRAARKLHTFKGMEYFSSISPNQEYIAYLREVRPMTNDRELHLAKWDGSEDIIYASGNLMHFQGWAPDSFHFAYDLFTTHQPLLGSLCGSPVPLVDLSQTPATQITWVDADHFLFVVGQEGSHPRELRLGQIGGESLVIGPFNGLKSIYEGQWTYFQIWQEGQDVIVP